MEVYRVSLLPPSVPKSPISANHRILLSILYVNEIHLLLTAATSNIFINLFNGTARGIPQYSMSWFATLSNNKPQEKLTARGKFERIWLKKGKVDLSGI